MRHKYQFIQRGHKNESKSSKHKWFKHMFFNKKTAVKISRVEINTTLRCPLVSLLDRSTNNTMVKVIGQQNRSKRATWISNISIWSINQFWIPNLSHSEAHLGRDAVSSTKWLCTRVLLQKAGRVTKIIQQHVVQKIVNQKQEMVWRSACNKLLKPSMARKRRL